MNRLASREDLAKARKESEERIEGINGTGNGSEKDHDHHSAPVFLYVGKQFGNPE